MPRSPSQSTSAGTSSTAARAPGLAITPTVLMVGIEQEFFVPFGAQNGAVHDAGFESEMAHGALDPVARRLVQFGLPYNPALAYLSPADLELRLDQYNHSTAGLQKGHNRRKDQRDRNEADVASCKRRQFADVGELQFARVDTLVDDYPHIVA